MAPPRDAQSPASGRRRTLVRLLGGALAAGLVPGRMALAQAASEPPDPFRRGINITNWFRFPANADPERLRAFMPDAAMAELRAAGFTFVRLCIQPQVMQRADNSLSPPHLAVLLEAIERLHRAGLAVIVDAHPETWNLEQRPADRAALFAFWHAMAPELRRFDPRDTMVEVMNEPVFEDHAAWAALQEELLGVIRRPLPGHTVVLTGADWGSIDGLLALRPVRDRRVVYSVHDYTPGILAHFASWEPGVDHGAMAGLPFPVTDAAACRAALAGSTHARTRDLGAFYCGERWNEARVRENLARAGAWGRRHGVPVMLLEFGATASLNAGARLAYMEAVRKAAEQEGMGWALWGYGDIMGFPAVSGPRPAVIDRAVLRALGLSGEAR